MKHQPLSHKIIRRIHRGIVYFLTYRLMLSVHEAVSVFGSAESPTLIVVFTAEFAEEIIIHVFYERVVYERIIENKILKEDNDHGK